MGLSCNPHIVTFIDACGLASTAHWISRDLGHLLDGLGPYYETLALPKEPVSDRVVLERLFAVLEYILYTKSPPVERTVEAWKAFLEEMQTDRIERELMGPGRLFLVEKACVPILNALDPLDLNDLIVGTAAMLVHHKGQGEVLSLCHFMLTGVCNVDDL